MAITDGRTDGRIDGQKNYKPPQDISLSIEMNQCAAQGYLDCLYQNPKLTKIPCFRHSGMSGESIERQASCETMVREHSRLGVKRLTCSDAAAALR